MIRAMYCRSCRYGLSGLPAGPCPECGRPFSPHDPKSYVRHPWRALFQGLIGLGLAIPLFGALILLNWFIFAWDHGTDRHAAFLAHVWGGLGLAFVAVILAAINRSWLGRLPLLMVGILAVWVGLFMGSDKYFRVWQSDPNATQEAYADTGPMGALIAGWLPGGMVVFMLYLPCWLVVALIRRRTDLRTESDRFPASEPTVRDTPSTVPPGGDRGV